MSRSERILLWSIAAAALLLRAVALFRYRFDSDEQQHLHVTWGWVAGGVQYRDFFDNHLPLFHMLTSPILSMLGERSTILLWMRVPMLLLFGVVVWGTFLIGQRLYTQRVGIWAAALLALFPPFFLKSLEYRNDNLWNALWIGALVVLTGGLSRMRMFLAGLTLGCALATSLKTALLVPALVAAAFVAWVFVMQRRVRLPPIHYAIAGFLIVPAALAIFFAASGALDALLYCNLTFNALFALTRKDLWIGRLVFPFAFAALLYIAWRFRETEMRWRYVLAVTMGIFTVTLCSYWLVISPRDFLPMMPLAAIFTAAALTRTGHPLRTFAALVCLSVVSLWHYADQFEDKTSWHITMMNQVLGLTRPHERIIDLKGETIYRKRPFYYIFEVIGRTLIAKGIIRDTLPEDVVRTQTYVAQADGPMWSPRARAFLSDHFINVGRLRVAGQWIAHDGSFTIAVPGRYVALNEHGEARGVLDGRVYTGGRQLTAGQHRFLRANPRERVAVVWAFSYTRGYSPFHLRDTEF